jgi:hypothetical protein
MGEGWGERKPEKGKERESGMRKRQRQREGLMDD